MLVILDLKVESLSDTPTIQYRYLTYYRPENDGLRESYYSYAMQKYCPNTLVNIQLIVSRQFAYSVLKSHPKRRKRTQNEPRRFASLSAHDSIGFVRSFVRLGLGICC